MKIRDLLCWESFYWVAKEASFTRAAARLKIGVPLLSKRIATLEEAFGVRLFNRTTRKVSLTQEGAALFPQAQAVLEDLQGLEDGLQHQGEVEGTIRITCVTALAHRLLTPVLAEFADAYPKVIFDLDATDAFVDLFDHQIDLAIRVEEPKGADFIYRKIMPNHLVLCASPDFVARAGRNIRHPKDLLTHPILMLKAYEHCQIKGAPFALGELLNQRKIICESGLLLTELACQGMGIAVRSIWDVRPLLDSGELVRLLKNHPIEPFGDMYAVVPTRRLMAHRVRTFLDFLMERSKAWPKI